MLKKHPFSLGLSKGPFARSSIHGTAKNHWRCGANMNTKATMSQYRKSMQMVRDDD
jgi:hypothetical protein